jgi:hypothetical protein
MGVKKLLILGSEPRPTSNPPLDVYSSLRTDDLEMMELYPSSPGPHPFGSLRK